MNEQLAKLFRNAAVYGFGRILGKVISFLLIPFYTHYFSAGEYGVMEILNLTAMIATVLLAPGLSTAVMRFYYDTEERSGKETGDQHRANQHLADRRRCGADYNSVPG